MVEFSITDIQLIDGPADAKRSTKVNVIVAGIDTPQRLRTMQTAIGRTNG